MNADMYTFAKRAVEEARKSKHEEGRTSPSPFVGAVAVRDGKIIETAYRGEREPGEHAEYTLLERKLKTEKLAGAVIFTTLEPCTKRNPPKIPCYIRLIERRVSTVVVGMVDPDDSVHHYGVDRLREAGITIEWFPDDLRVELEELNRDFIRDRKAKASANRAEPKPAESAAPRLVPLADWEQIDPPYLDALPPLRHDEVIRYFDGAVPTWRHAISTAIPRRQTLSEIASRLTALDLAKADCSIQLIRGAGGEGKTTLLLQAASDAARTGRWKVLWRPSPRILLRPDHVLSLEAANQWLVVADDAENLIRSLTDAAHLLHQQGRTNVHFLLAARDTDWLAEHGDKPAWDTWVRAWIKRQDAIMLRGIAPEDAKAIVGAWGKCGAEGLRELGRLSDSTKQVAALRDAVADVSREQGSVNRRQPVQGSLFGGLLAVRFGATGLKAHVRSLLTRLKDIPIERGGSNTLFDAILYVAACHGVGIPGIDVNVLADLVGVPKEWVQSLVVRPLGEEAAAVQSAGHVLTRHSEVAATVLAEAEQSLGVDLAEVWTQLVRQTVRTSRDVRVSYQTHPRILHAGPRLQMDLPQELPEARRAAIAIAAAKASTAALPERLDCVVDLGKTYRHAGEYENAVHVFRENLASTSAKVDFSEVIRGYWYEWSVCEGESGAGREPAVANAWLGGAALSDYLNDAPITDDNLKLICAGLGVAFGKLAERRPDCLYARARRAAAFLGRFSNPDPRSAGYYDRYDRAADKIGTPYAKDIAEAITWLTAGTTSAQGELSDRFLSELGKSMHVSHKRLQEILLEKRTH